MTPDQRMQEILCAWAEAKWKLAGVVHVKMESGYDEGWSEYTPGIGAYTDVTVTLEKREGGMTWKGTREFQVEDTTDLINEILRFAVGGGIK